MEFKIKLKIKDVEIELDRKDLKELKNILEELFPKEKEYVPYYPYVWTYRHWDYTPIVTWYDTKTSGTTYTTSNSDNTICGTLTYNN